MSEEFTYAFSWEAATERFEAAASIPVAEAEAMAEALSGPQPGYEVRLLIVSFSRYHCRHS